MKRVFLLMTTILLMAAASGCMQTPQEEAPPEQEPEQSQPLHLTSLSIELQRDGQNAQQLLDAVKILPQELQTALASYDVTVDEITMTVGSSHTATMQALESGSIAWTLLKSPFPAVRADFNALTELPIRTRSFLASFMEATISSAKSSFFPSTVS